MIMNVSDAENSSVDTESSPYIADNNEISEWAKAAVYQAYRIGILNGTEENIFSPLQNSTRAEAATVIKRLCDAADEL